jgi:hypothetical protein
MSSMGDSHNLIPILRQHFAGGKYIGEPVGVEVGTHRGALSAALLREFKNLTLWMVDSYAEHPAHSPYAKSGDSLAALTFREQTAHMEAAKAATEFAAGRRHLLRIPSLKAAERIPCKRLAFVFLDGSHALEDVRADIAAWWPRVEPGGILAGHDYSHRRYTGVKEAVDAFAAAEGLQIGLLGSCWYVAKPGQPFVPEDKPKDWDKGSE